MSRKALDKLIPVAEKTGVVIALENVWSNLWVLPKLFAHFVRSFQCPWIQSYFDIGNHVKYAKPEAWIESLGKTIVKLHVKDFKIDRAAPQGGEFVDIRDGDVDLAVRHPRARSGRLPRLADDRRLGRLVDGRAKPAAGPDSGREVACASFLPTAAARVGH